jgi:DNA-binding PadR family transcriptional regulator
MQDADDPQDSIATDLTRFQLEILYLLADEEDQREYGLAIKRRLEDFYDEAVNHGRLYPNLDQLVEAGLVSKGAIDKRTNYYELTSDGGEVLRRDAQRRLNAVEQLPGNEDDSRSSTTAVAGGDD